MPTRAGRPCAAPGCVAIVKDGWLCEEHAVKRLEEYETQRGNAHARGYGTNWRRLRSLVLAAHPLCVDPFGIHPSPVAATDVDHKVSKRNGGRDTMDNLQSLCHECHSKKTAKEDKRWQ